MKFWKCAGAAVTLGAGALLAVLPAKAAQILQCVPYARAVSGLEIYGDAWTWWDQAAGHYDRGHRPRKGAVLAFQPFGPMQLGHVAVGSRVLSHREVLIRHANWSSPGAIEEDVLAIDVSQEGDWSAVRVWHTPTGQMGARTNPTFGFIYPKKARLLPFDGGGGMRLATPALYTVTEDAPRVRPLADTGAPKPVKLALRRDIFRTDYAGGVVKRKSVGEVSHASARTRSLGDIIADVKRDARMD